MPIKLINKILLTVQSLFTLLFGKFSWTTPTWIQYLHQQSRNQPKKFWGILTSLLIIIALFLGAYGWYLSLPQPVRIQTKIMTPALTPDAKKLVPRPLIIHFGVLSQNQFIQKPVAPLKWVGKAVPQGPTLVPEIKGSWVWETDNRLVFTPETDWPAGETYHLYFAKDFFAPNTNMQSYSASFATLPFTAAIREIKFYQDPLAPQIRQVVATLGFSHPVEPNSLEDHIQLAWQSLKEGPIEGPPFKFNLNFSENKRTAYLRSLPLSLPASERFINLSLQKGIKPITGPAKTEETIAAKVLVPDATSYFKILKVATAIVRDLQNRPQQVLTIESTLGLTALALNKALHVYVLPQDHPATAIEPMQPHYPWQNPGEVTPDILKLSHPLSLQTLPAEHDFATLHSYRFDETASPAYLYVKIDKGVRGLGDFALANDYTAVLKVPPYPQEIAFLHQGALLALGTEEKLSVLVRGLSAVKFDIARVLPEDINHLVTQTGGDFSNPSFIDYHFDQNNISEIFSQTIPFDITNAANEQYTAIDFSKYLATRTNTKGPLGLFLLKASGWDPKRNTSVGVENNRLILITDLGVIVKDNRDATHDVFVQSITQGTPVSLAQVEILGKNGLPLLTGTTDAQGHVSFPSLKDFIQEREPTVYLIHKDNDVSFIPYYRADRQLNYSRFDVGGTTTNNEDQAALIAYLFSDRGIYRPGDTAHIGMIVKQPYVIPQPEGLPLEATVIDPRGITVKDVKLGLGASGYLSLDFQTTPTSPTGPYLVYLYIVKDNQPGSLLGSTTLQVAEFLPDRLRISAHLSQEETQGWVSPTDLRAQIHLWNLYGAPAADHRISGKILLAPKPVVFKQYPDYIFIDPLLNPKSPPKVFTDTLAETKTDAQGQAELDLKLERFEKATYQLTVFVEGFEAEGGRSVTTQVNSLVSPLTALIGYKSDGDLAYIKQNDFRRVHFIAIDPKLKQQALGALKLQLFKQHTVSTLVKKEDGTYQYQSVLQSSQISSVPFSVPVAGTDYSLSTGEIGDFLVSVIDEHDGIELSRFKYTVVGSGALPVPKNAELNVKLNKTEFDPNEDIEMQITAPYTGAGLMTIERDKVYSYQWFKTNTTSSVQKIRLPQNLQGDGYVNIDFVRDLNSPEIFMSPLSYNVSPFSITHRDQTMQVQLSTPNLVRPGSPLTIIYQSDKPGKIIVFAVDEGILQVTHYQTPDPLQFFFAKHALEVSTSQIVDQILPQFIADRELSTIGGDEGQAAISKNMNPFKRKTEAPVVYWSGIIDTDMKPRQLVYSVPDYFNGALRIMAVGVAANAVGAASKTTEVRGDFIINPNVPTFVTPGDEFDVSASIANNVENSGQNAKIIATLQVSPQLEIIGPASQTLVIPEKEERNLHFKLRAKTELGQASLLFTVSLGNKSSHLSSTLSLRPAAPFAVSILSGHTTDAKNKLVLDRLLYPEYRNVDLLVSRSPLILIIGLQNYLKDYPYGCVEQLVSKALPWLVMLKQPFAYNTRAMRERIEETIQLLGLRQTANGSFDFWPGVGATQNNDFASVYATHFLTEAKEQGMDVPREVFIASLNFLKTLATQPVTNLNEARVQAYAIYILTRNEILTTNYLINLQLTLDNHPEYQWQQDIINVYIAATYQLLKNSADAEKILRRYKPQTSAVMQTDFYTQNTINAQYLYLLARHFPQYLSGLSDDFVISMVGALNTGSISTILAGYTSLALAAYAPYARTSSSSDLGLTGIMANDKTKVLSTDGVTDKSIKLGPDIGSVIVNDPKKQGYFYQLTQAGFDQQLPKKAITQHIEVYREYTDKDNKDVGEVHLGDEIVVHLRIRSLDDQYHDNIVIVDLLPGGFDPVLQSINSANMDYVDTREDRVIFFGSASPDSKEITYRIKATNTGTFKVPPIFATDMYDPKVQSIGTVNTLQVIAPATME